MRYLLSLLFILALCTCGRAQDTLVKQTGVPYYTDVPTQAPARERSPSVAFVMDSSKWYFYDYAAEEWRQLSGSGASGLDGNGVLNGQGAPISDLGRDGDFYYDYDNLRFYGPKTGGAWGNGRLLSGPQGPAGPAGAGVTIRGSVASAMLLPMPYSGDVGDMYITEDDGHGHVWQGSSWLDVGEIRGPQGPQGDPATDDQQLSINGRVISLDNSPDITLPPDNVVDGDADPTNERQFLAYSFNQLNISDGNTVTIPDEVDDADADPSNEIQQLSISGYSLTLSDGGTVVLPNNAVVDTIRPVRETVTYISEGLNVQAIIDYDTLARNAPVLIMQHQFSGNSEDIADETVERFLKEGFFIVRPQMRGRTGSQGTMDAGANEIKDAFAGLQYVQDNYQELIDHNRAIAYGLSGGGGNALSLVTKYPFYFSGAVNYFGIGNYGRQADSTGWYYTNPERQNQIKGIIGASPSTEPRFYAARNSTAAIANFANPIFNFHDVGDAAVSVLLTTELRDFAEAKGLNTPVFISDAGDTYRFLHQEASLVPGNIESEKWWTEQVKGYARPVQSNVGELVVAGYVFTPLFNLTMDDGDNAAGIVRYNFAQSYPAIEVDVTAGGGRLTIRFNQRSPGDTVTVNGCPYAIDDDLTTEVYINYVEPIDDNVAFTGLYGVTSDTIGDVISYTGSDETDYGDLGYGYDVLLTSDTISAVFRGGVAAILGINTSDGDPGEPRDRAWYDFMEFGIGGAGSGTRINVKNNFSGVSGAGIVDGTRLRIYRTETQLISQYRHPGGAWTASSSLALSADVPAYIQMNFRDGGKLSEVKHDKVNPQHCQPVLALVPSSGSGTTDSIDWTRITNIPADIADGDDDTPNTDSQDPTIADGGIGLTGSSTTVNPLHARDGSGSGGDSWNTFVHSGLRSKYFGSGAIDGPTGAVAAYYGLNIGSSLGFRTQIAIPLVHSQSGTFQYRVWNRDANAYDAWKPIYEEALKRNGSRLFTTEFNSLSINRTDGSGVLNLRAPNLSGTRESLADFSVADANRSRFGIANGTTSNGVFSPLLFGYEDTDRQAFIFRAMANTTSGATSTNAMMLFQVGLTSNPDDPNNGNLSSTTRPIADFFNVGNRALRIETDGDLTGAHRVNMSQPVSAAEDGYVKTYDHATGQVELKPAPSGNDDLGSHALTQDLTTSTHAIRETANTGSGLSMRLDGFDLDYSGLITRLTNDQLTFFDGGKNGLEVIFGSMYQAIGNSFLRLMPNLIPDEDEMAWTNNPLGTGQYTRLDRHDGLTTTTPYNFFPPGPWARVPALDVEVRQGVQYGFELKVFYSSTIEDGDIRFSLASGTLSGTYKVGSGDGPLDGTFINNRVLNLPVSGGSIITFHGTFTSDTDTTLEAEFQSDQTNDFFLDPGTEMKTWIIK